MGDIEFLARPRMQTELFGGDKPDIEPVKIAMRSMGGWVKGGERYMQVANVFGSGVSLDLFLCHPPAQWGSLMLIRTGPAKFSERVVSRIKATGHMRHKDGRVVDVATGITRPTPREEDLFRLAGMEYVPPKERK